MEIILDYNQIESTVKCKLFVQTPKKSRHDTIQGFGRQPHWLMEEVMQRVYFVVYNIEKPYEDIVFY